MFSPGAKYARALVLFNDEASTAVLRVHGKSFLQRWTMNGKKGGTNFQLTAEEHANLCVKLEEMLLLAELDGVFFGLET